MSVINITEDQMKRFQTICKKRPQDAKQRDTFEYLLRLDTEFGIRNERGINPIPAKHAPGGITSPILDGNLRIVTPTTLAEKMTKGALKKTSEAIGKAYPPEVDTP
jgi:hypothetical protein